MFNLVVKTGTMAAQLITKTGVKKRVIAFNSDNLVMAANVTKK